MPKTRLTVNGKCGSYEKSDEYIYPYSEYSPLCKYIERVFANGNFDTVAIEREGE